MSKQEQLTVNEAIQKVMEATNNAVGGSLAEFAASMNQVGQTMVDAQRMAMMQTRLGVLLEQRAGFAKEIEKYRDTMPILVGMIQTNLDRIDEQILDVFAENGVDRKTARKQLTNTFENVEILDRKENGQIAGTRRLNGVAAN